jgi:TonB family protein
VQPDGSTADIEVAHDEPSGQFEESATRAFFEENAIRALQQWRYEPVIRNGQPVAQQAEIRIKFRL